MKKIKRLSLLISISTILFGLLLFVYALSGTIIRNESELFVSFFRELYHDLFVLLIVISLLLIVLGVFSLAFFKAQSASYVLIIILFVVYGVASFISMFTIAFASINLKLNNLTYFIVILARFIVYIGEMCLGIVYFINVQNLKKCEKTLNFAKQLLLKNDFKNALRNFETIKGYKDADNYINICKEKLIESEKNNLTNL